ncbi:hypothetical protein HMPREF1050_0653 [Haemophilus parahaemolyticus HK385]|uniref:Uncharacterized protein n=1 Tax=Haemophilus parahaemolyticus HK385 TaxID=1095744 RepID=A0ABP2P0F7_HAEPH|nr:hypothetical protein HMPREF1050_0653 [Haemophilus parahaemolyticus HK385]
MHYADFIPARQTFFRKKCDFYLFCRQFQHFGIKTAFFVY